jgi:short-subunit dehydrogenase
MKIDFSGGMPPEKVARRIVKALKANQAEAVLGWEARLILSVNRFLPRLVDRVLARKVRQWYADEMAGG